LAKQKIGFASTQGPKGGWEMSSGKNMGEDKNLVKEKNTQTDVKPQGAPIEVEQGDLKGGAHVRRGRGFGREKKKKDLEKGFLGG